MPRVSAAAPPPIRIRWAPPGMYLTTDDQLIELPDDMTAEDMAKLEAEARAAEKRLGKGPPPKPVPDVRKLEKKEEKKERLKLKGKGGRGARGKGAAGSKSAGSAAAALKAVGTSKVAQYLAGKAAPVLVKGFGRLQKLRQNEQTHDDAPQKLNQTEKAVVIPESEGQSKSNDAQVEMVGDRRAPVVDENKGKEKLQEKLAENIPRTIEDVDNFKSAKKAQLMGADVMLVVHNDKNAVVSTFEDMKQTPPPAPREHEPEELPPQEVAPATGTMNLGQGAIAPLQKEHTDLSNYTNEADSKLKEEGVTQEQLDMVDSGDLAKANQEKKGLEKAAKEEPLVVQKLAQQEATKVDKDLKQQENKERSVMKAKRKADLGATSQKQKSAKSELEKKREEVAGKINGIYTTAQDKVKKRLAELEKESVKRFDEGNARATKDFEDNVNREIEAFKDDRYSGWFGWARRVRDWVKGIDDLPQVKAIFERNRSTFVSTINTLVENISADNKRVIQECKDELTNAKAEIKRYVATLKPSLQGIGKKAAKEMNSKLDAMDQFIAKKEEDLQNTLKDKQTAAIKAIDEKIEKMKEAMAGALAKLGKLLLWAAKKFFTWALEKFGFSLSDIESIISKGVAVLKAIFTGPIKFVKNLIKAASTGFKNFGKNFITHLKNAVFEWLTGSLEGVRLPDTWDLKGVLSVLFQMVGISKENIRVHLLKYIPQPVLETLERTFGLVITLFKEGPMAAWEQLQEIGAEIQTAFVDAIKDWIKWQVVEKAIQTVLSLFIPGAGIIRAIIAIYDTIVFFIQKAKDIMRMIGSFLGSIAEIAAGNIGAAAAALEEGLARGLVLVIEFLARFLRLSGITAAIRKVVQKVRGKVDNVLDKIAKWVVGKAKKVVGKGVATVKAGVAAVAQWWRTRVKFRAPDGETHSLYFEGERSPTLTLSSTPITIDAFLNQRTREARDKKNALTAAERSTILSVVPTARPIVANIKSYTYNPTDDPGVGPKVNQLITQLSETIKPIMTASAAPVPPLTMRPGFSSAKADDLSIKYLFKGPGNHQPGTEASAYQGTLSGALPHLVSLGIRTNWVAFHLLNHNGGGLAVDSNLIPTTRTINGDYFDEFEDDMLTAHKTNPVWMNVALSYHSTDLRFVQSLVVSGGSMAWNKEKQTWTEDTKSSAKFKPFRRAPIPLPRPNAIFINRLPDDPVERAALLTGSRLTAAMVNIVRSQVRTRVESRDDLIGILKNYVHTLEPANAARTMRDFIARIRDTKIDYS